MRLLTLSLGAILFLGIGCQDEKITNLEKQNQKLKAAAEKDHATADYDLQAKCSKDAKAWFNENWSRDKDTLLLDFTNHYNKPMNKCFIYVEYHFSYGPNGSWSNDITLWDVYENVKYGNFSENHMVFNKPTIDTKTLAGNCELLDKKCKTIDEFSDLVRPYLNN